MSAGREPSLPVHAVILAGGRGTRFWPRSRSRTPKQLLSIVGERTMLQQTVERLAPLLPLSRIWVVTNREQAAAVRRQIPRLSPARVLAEPVGRNTAAAIGLAAVHISRRSPGRDALMAVLPADHFITRAGSYRRILRAALRLAAQPGRLVVLGIPPTRPETGFGYIERGPLQARPGGTPAYAVRRFTEKPRPARARGFVASGRYLWNAGMFFWRVSTYLDQLRRFLPKTHDALRSLAKTIGTHRYPAALQRVYSSLPSISVDYAILEPASRTERGRVAVLPADVGWSDIGSWAAVYDLLARHAGANVSAGPLLPLDSRGCFFWAPRKLVAAVGLRDLVMVETPDAVLLCPRERAQDVARVVKGLEHRSLRSLL